MRILNIDFKKNIRKDPAWAATLNHPVTVIGRINLEGSNIETLSPWLTFQPNDEEGNLVNDPCWAVWDYNFQGCEKLTRAEGKFRGNVTFINAGVEEIDPGFEVASDLQSNFDYCPVRIARGKFAGRVRFDYCPIIAIEHFQASQATFRNCMGIQHCPEEILVNPEIKIDFLIRTKLLKEMVARKHLGEIRKEGILL